MLSLFLKRVLPFALTLLVGVALGGFTNLFRARTDLAPSAPRTVVVRERRGSCRDRFVFESGRAGRLISIVRQTDSGAWVPTRPVSPEIYELTTRPAIIRSRPSAFLADELRREGVSGTVTVEATLAPDGRVTNIRRSERGVREQEALVMALEAEAAAAAERLEFMPALKDNRPVAQRVRLEYRFE